MKRRSLMAIFAQICVACSIIGGRPAIAASSPYANIMHCSAELPPAPPHKHDAADVNGASVLYAYGDFRRNFSISADLTLPKVAQNRGVFYADWIILIPRGRASQQFLLPFVQINLLRWARFNYRPEVAFTWAGRDGKLIYADSSIFLDERVPHTFGIAVSGPRLTMSVDHHNV